MTVVWADDGQRQGTVEVPLDREDPSAGTTEVTLRRRAARNPDERVGVLFVNPGGPGLSGFDLVDNAASVFTSEITSRFDIVAVAPRGTFEPLEVECLDGDEFADFITGVDWSPDAQGDAEALADHISAAWESCLAGSDGLFEHVSTMDTVHDMALVVEALGEDQVSYYGASYGAPLGATFATVYPDLVRAAVLDAAFHPQMDPAASWLARVRSFEARLAALYKECDSDESCPIDGDTRAAFERVAAVADAERLRTNPDLPPINDEALFASVFFHPDVYRGASNRSLLSAVAQADGGDSGALQSRFADLVGFQAESTAIIPINCIDHPTRGADRRPADLPERVAAEAPLFDALFPFAQGRSGECELWPVNQEPMPNPLTAESSGPLLLLTSIDDVITPVGSAEQLNDELVDSALVYVESSIHTAYNTSRELAHRCATDAVDAFLTTLERPADGTICAAE